MHNWPAYYEAVANAKPRRPLLEALDRIECSPNSPEGRQAVDLGCGGGTDTVELLRRGWRVLAIDAEPRAIEILLTRPDLTARDNLQTVTSELQATTWPKVDLVNASLSLPFLPPHAFDTVWSRIVDSLEPGGRFAGHLFGDRDAWAQLPSRTHHSRAQALALLEAFDVEFFAEREWDGQTALGAPKHWHLFEIVGRLPGSGRLVANDRQDGGDSHP
jgi:tellurite methyltransferase